VQLGGDGDDRFDVVAGEHAQVVERHDVERVGHGKREHVARDGDGEHLVLAGEGLGHLGENFLGDGVVRDADVRNAELLAQGDDEVVLGEILFLDQQGGQALPGGALDVHAFLELLAGDEALLEEHVG
jgi:hypothetical protein